MKTENRLLALDVFRGITIAGMILVNDPGSWSAVYAPLCHASWNGLTPTDLVFPFFMFIMGISMYFSLRRYNSLFSRGAVTKIFRRAVLIFLIGLGINWFALWFGTFMSMGNGEFTFWERFTQNIFPVSDIGGITKISACLFGGSYPLLRNKTTLSIVYGSYDFSGVFCDFSGGRGVYPFGA